MDFKPLTHIHKQMPSLLLLNLYNICIPPLELWRFQDTDGENLSQNGWTPLEDWRGSRATSCSLERKKAQALKLILPE